MRFKILFSFLPPSRFLTEGVYLRMGNNVTIYVLNLDKGVGAIVGKAAEVRRSAFGVIQGVRNIGVRQWEAREL